MKELLETKLINKQTKNYIELIKDIKVLFDGYEKDDNLIFITEKSYLQIKDLNSSKI